ncbi:AT-hook motif nuclear-localized protein 9-like [Tripterygium wilfordii]|uniref:AT-hook motif nuclear-localized protein 9-like n=1 Tax=Tripterygium wilfordii TaxID=458696 RepID=UPI0018F8625A|nr:AT-hook motif nuclear-localized protein 9-like [Tripterygium wilfordii]
MTIPVPPRGNLDQQSLVFPAAAGEDFTPLVLMVQPGEDVIEKISSLNQFPGTITVITAIGDISSVVLGHPSCTGVSMRIEGHFPILMLSGLITFTETGMISPNNEPFRVVMAKPDGGTFGGAVIGPLIAHTPIQLVLGNFSQSNGREVQSSSTAAAADNPNIIQDEPSSHNEHFEGVNHVRR